MVYFPILGEIKAKKALLKNAGNIEKIHKMYWEIFDYKIIYPDKTEIKKKFKYKVIDILKKFNIHSVNELLFLFYRYYEPKRVCEFCDREIYNFPMRNNYHNNDCRHKGICSKCNEPTTMLCQENKYCYDCRDKKEGYIQHLGHLLNLIQQTEVEIRLHYNLNINDLNWVISFLEEKLIIFKKLFEEISHGSELPTNNLG